MSGRIRGGWFGAWGMLAALAFVLSTCAAGAAEKPKKETEEEKEAKKAAEEDAQEAATSGTAFRAVTLKGRLTVNPIQDGDTVRTVAGSLATVQGTFVLKVESMRFREVLAKHDGKDVTLIGKMRNEGKYFVALSIDAPGFTPKQPLILKPGGM